MPAWRAEVDRWLLQHNGVIGLAELVGLGCSVRTIRRMVADGRLITMQPGIFRSAQWPESRLQELTAICMRDPDAVIAFTTAAKLWGWRRVDDDRIHVLVPHHAKPRFRGAITHRSRSINPVDVVQRADGIRVTSPPRTFFDSADMLGIDAARSVLEQILHERTCTLGTVIDTVVRLGHPHRPGTRVSTEVLASRPRWRRALHSDLESRVLREIERQGLPAPVAQCPIQLPAERDIHVDFGWPQWKVGLEVDDPTWHAGQLEHHRDLHRDRKAATVGWIVPRVSKIDVNGSLSQAVADVAAILHLRAAA